MQINYYSPVRNPQLKQVKSEKLKTKSEVGSGKPTTSNQQPTTNLLTVFFLITFLLLGFTGFSQKTHIPDANFRKVLLDSYNIVAQNNSILNSDAAGVTQLYVSKNYYNTPDSEKISDLTGIEAFISLTELYCSGNQLTSLDVSANTALTSLSCGINQLTSLDVSTNTSLTFLDCGRYIYSNDIGNLLTDLDISANTALTSLNCGGNKLENLDISANTALTTLNCGGNELENLDVSRNTALTTLTCYNAELTSLNVSGCTSLTELSYYGGNSRGELISLDASGCTSLTSLSCTRNSLTSLDVSGCTSLTSLNCKDNQLTRLNISGNTALTSLGCEGNELMTLDISANTALTSLYCGENPLTILDISANTALTSLSCGGNPLMNLDTSANTALTSLSCGRSLFTSLDISANTKLVSLSCESNQLTSLDVSANTRLTGLGCGQNILTSFDVSANTKLTSLSCQENQLTSLDVSANTRLTSLYCNQNLLTSLDVSANKRLTDLNCNQNLLTSLDVSANKRLTYLQCRSNQLTSLNVKNGNNLNMYCYFGGNYSLTCIQVDSAEWSTAHWSKNGQQYFSENCSGTADTEAPIITLKGANPQIIELGTAYTELGATATDNVDGDISANIVIDATAVNINSVGDYSVTYNISDAAGNPAIEVIRTVTVTSPADTEAAIITLNGDNPQIIELGTSYTELGAAATDNVDGDISANIVIDATAVDINSVGDYSVTYNISDAAGNPAIEVIRTVTITSPADTEAPIITLDGDNPQIIELGTSYTELGAAATDNVDGDISANIVIDATAVNINSVGDYSVTYNISDAAGNPAIEVIRTVTITSPADTEAPIITLKGANPQAIELGTAYTELGATATDNVDGDISANIVIDATAVNINSVGDYSVTYNISDAAGNPAIEVIRTVTVTVAAPTTPIPDDNFEDALIALGIDSNGKNNTILNSDAAAVNSLDISNKSIASLAGIEAFISLTSLNCGGNPSTSLDVSANTKLISLSCGRNQLTSLDVSANTELTSLDCGTSILTSLDISANTKLTILECSINRLTTLDVSANTRLTILECSVNQLTNLDVSANTDLTVLKCSSNGLTSLDVSENKNLTTLECYLNKLISLDVKNENNHNMSYLSCHTNLALTCIQVDNAVWSTANWVSKIDGQHYFSENCAYLGNEDFEEMSFTISPNPTADILNITIDEKADYRLLNVRGQTLKRGVLDVGESKINFSSFAKGIYFLNIKTSKGSFTEKVVRD